MNKTPNGFYLTEITDIYDARIAPYRVMTLRNADSHNSDATFIADGKRVVETLLRSTAGIRSIFALPEFYELYGEQIAARNLPEGTLLAASAEVMENITGFRHHSGVMAVGVRPAFVPFDKIEFPAIGLCGVINPENVGIIARNCAGLGFRSLIIDEATCSPYLRRAMRVSMGATLLLHICRVESFPDALTKISTERVPQMIAAETLENAVPPDAIAWKERTLILFGSEDKGISAETLAICNAVTAIPVTPSVHSLNVAAASSIILYAATAKLAILN